MVDKPAAADRMFKAANYFLEHRDFESCRKYVLRGKEHCPQAPDFDQILAVADVLKAAQTLVAGTHRDWYSILQVTRSSQDTQQMNDKFDDLNFLLDPKDNKFPFAAEAFEHVCNAWAVLSDPDKRHQFDKFLRDYESKGDCGGDGEQFQEPKVENDAFWTICPYCYFVYEFARVYEDCCLKCQNEKCGRAFHAVKVASPPMDVVEDGQYKCSGFYPIGFGGNAKNFSPWVPFVPISVKENKSMPKDDTDTPHNVGTTYIEINDESDNSEGGAAARDAIDFMYSTNTNQAGVMKQSDKVRNMEKLVMKRKKSVAKATKKLMGRGTRIDKHDSCL